MLVHAGQIAAGQVGTAQVSAAEADEIDGIATQPGGGRGCSVSGELRDGEQPFPAVGAVLHHRADELQHSHGCGLAAAERRRQGVELLRDEPAQRRPATAVIAGEQEVLRPAVAGARIIHIGLHEPQELPVEHAELSGELVRREKTR
jgi:hypothetical protein